MDFKREGVVFRAHGGRTTCAGPAGRADLLRVLRAELAWREDAMREHVRAHASAWPMPRVELIEPPPAPMGACGCCGDPLPAYRGGDCELCAMAFERALRAEGRIP